MAKPMFETAAVGGGNLCALADIVPGGIVSKTLVDTPAAKLVLFAFDAGQELSEHRSPYTAIVEVVSGTLAFTVAGQRREMAADDWLVMPPNAAHSLVATTPCRMLLTLVKG